MQAFQQGLMTGAQLGGRMRQSRLDREIGGLMSGGDYSGAANAAFAGGDLRAGQALNQYGQQQAQVERQGQITQALQSGDYDGATTFASSPEELAQIAQFRANATQQEREEAAHQAGQMAAVIQSIQSLPPEQQFAAVQQYAPQFGIDPSRLTPESISPQMLEAYRVQALGLKDYLAHQDRLADNARQDRTAEANLAAIQALAQQRQASAGAANARAARASSGGGSGGSGRTNTPRASAPSSRPWQRSW